MLLKNYRKSLEVSAYELWNRALKLDEAISTHMAKLVHKVKSHVRADLSNT